MQTIKYAKLTTSGQEFYDYLQPGADVVFENWTDRLKETFGEAADLKMRYLLENKKNRKDLFSLFIKVLQGVSIDEGRDLGPLFKKVWSLDYSISDFFTEIACLESALSQYLRSHEELEGSKLADWLEVIYSNLNQLGAAVLKGCAQLFEHIAETSKMGFCQTDPDGRITFANLEMQRLVGKESLIGDTLEGLFEGDEKQIVHDAVHKDGHHQGELRQLSLRSATGDSTPVGVELGPVVIDGTYKGGYAHITDITRPVELQNKVFDQSLMGIIKLDHRGNVTFANKSMQQLVGTTDWRNRSVRDFLPDEKTWEMVQEKLAKRISIGKSEEYELEVKRLNDQKLIPVMVSAFPELDLSGNKVIGSFAMVRNILAEKIHRHIETYRDENSLLTAVAAELSLMVPFDLMAVSEYSSDLRHARTFFSLKPDTKPTWERRWWELTPARIKWASQNDVIIVDNLDEFFSQPDWVDLREEPDIQWVFKEGFSCFIYYPIFGDNRLVAALSLMTKTHCAYDEHYKDLIKRLPIDMAIQMALYYHHKREMKFVSDLIRCISSAGSSVKEISRVIVEMIADYYDWSSVSLYKINKQRGKLCLLKQAASKGNYKLPEGYKQDIDTGVLGYVCRKGEMLNIGDVTTDPKFKKIYIPAVKGGQMRSELCLPLKFGEIPWLLNIEDIQVNAFSTEEVKAIKSVMGEVSEFLEKSWLSHFLEASLATTTDAIIVSDSTAMVVQANPSAAEMFDIDVLQGLETEMGDGPASDSPAIVRVKPKPIRELFVNPVEADNIIKNRQAPKTALMVKKPSGGTRPVLLSMVDLQEDFGYTVFGAADLTTQKRLEEIENLGDIYLEIATQTKTPLFLAYGWLNRLKRQMPAVEERDALDKVIRQLRKLEITYDRLALYADDQSAMPFNPCLLDITEVLEDVRNDLPASDADKVNWQYSKGDLFVNGDLFQLRFCVETVLAYLLRFVPEENQITLKTFRKGAELVTAISGWHPPKHRVNVEIEREKQTDLAKALVDMAFGEKVIKKFIANHNGFYLPPEQVGDTIRFELNLPLAEEESHVP